MSPIQSILQHNRPILYVRAGEWLLSQQSIVSFWSIQNTSFSPPKAGKTLPHAAHGAPHGRLTLLFTVSYVHITRHAISHTTCSYFHTCSGKRRRKACRRTVSGQLVEILTRKGTGWIHRPVSGAFPRSRRPAAAPRRYIRFSPTRRLTVHMLFLGSGQVVVGRLAHDLPRGRSCHLVLERGGFVCYVSGHRVDRFSGSPVPLAASRLSWSTQTHGGFGKCLLAMEPEG